MRIDFTPRLERNPLAFAQMGAGLLQGIGGFIQNRRATKQLEKMQSPTYKQNASILDFYNKSLAKYNVNPYNTDLYRMQQQQADRGMASGLSALQGRGQALAGVNQLVQGRNDNLLKAGVEAEQLSRQDLNRLGQAAGMKTAEDQRAFQINQQDPFERKYNLLANKAGGGADIMNSGLSNMFQGASTYGQTKMLDKMYKNDGGGGSPMMGGSGMGAASYGNNVLQNLYRNQNRGMSSGISNNTSVNSISPEAAAYGNPVLQSLYRNQNRRVGTRNVQIGG